MQAPEQADGKLFPSEELAGIGFVEVFQTFIRWLTGLGGQRLEIDDLIVSDDRFYDDGGVDDVAGNANAVATA